MFLFSSFVNRLPELISENIVENDVAKSLRVLYFMYALKYCATPDTVIAFYLQYWYDTEEQLIRVDRNTSISVFFEIFPQEEPLLQTRSHVIEMILRHFFSCGWLTSIDLKWREDLSFLLLSTSTISQQLFIVLLKNACVFGAEMKKKQGHPQRVVDPIMGMSLSRLNVICSELKLNCSSLFSADGRRVSIQHYIPSWLSTECERNWKCDGCDDNTAFSMFFSNYQNSFEGDLVHTVFDMFFGIIAEQAETKSSQNLLLDLMKDIELETSLTS